MVALGMPRPREEIGLSLRQALDFLEREAATLSLGEVAHLLGCARQALEDELQRPAASDGK